MMGLIVHRLMIELPLDSFMGIAWPQWLSLVIGLLLLSWFLDDDSNHI
jgi:hypothetical protein